METAPENQEEETASKQKEQGVDNEELAKEIPTVTPDDDNLEPEQDKDEDE
jgi:hypothetical protein